MIAWAKTKLANGVARLLRRATQAFFRNKRVHRIKFHDGIPHYFGEGRVIAASLDYDENGRAEDLKLHWTSVGTETPDFRKASISRFRLYRPLGWIYQEE